MYLLPENRCRVPFVFFRKLREQAMKNIITLYIVRLFYHEIVYVFHTVYTIYIETLKLIYYTLLF